MSLDRARAIAIRRASVRTGTRPRSVRSWFNASTMAVSVAVSVAASTVYVVADAVLGIAIAARAATARSTDARRRRRGAGLGWTMPERSRRRPRRGMGEASRGPLAIGTGPGLRRWREASPPLPTRPPRTAPERMADLWD